MTLLSAFVTALKKTTISVIKRTLFSGLPSQNLTHRSLSGKAHGASVIRAGILNVQLSAVSTTASISTFTVAVLTTHFLIIPMKLHRARLTSVISGASIGSMYSTSMMQEVK